MKIVVKRIIGISVVVFVYVSNTLFTNHNPKTVEAVEEVLATQRWYLIENSTAAHRMPACC